MATTVRNSVVMKGLIFRLITFLPMFLSWWAPAQETIWTDTLRAAVKTDTRSIVRSINKLESGADVLRGVVSPMGEGDPIRWSQALPGVSTGADGSSAMYVHGGNMGNSLFSLDGVPVYGYSHILGLTTTVPSTVIESTSLSKGGFEGRYGNFTAAHLNIVTSDPAADRVHAEGTLNNFLAGANAEAPLGHGMSFIASARISPIGLEYKAFSQLLPARLAAFQDFRAGVGDFYGKFNWTIDNRNSLSASTLLSLDQYGFTTGEGSRDALGWNNEIAILKYHRIFDRTEMDTQAYVNRYGSMQRQEKNYHGTDNILSLNSSMLEAALSADFSPRQNSSWKMDYGFKARYGRFAMGPAGTRSGKGVTLVSAYIQTTRELPDKLHLQAELLLQFRRWLEYAPPGRQPLFQVEPHQIIGSGRLRRLCASVLPHAGGPPARLVDGCHRSFRKDCTSRVRPSGQLGFQPHFGPALRLAGGLLQADGQSRVLQVRSGSVYGRLCRLGT